MKQKSFFCLLWGKKNGGGPAMAGLKPETSN
jgi:hypothetical protein